VPAAKTKSAPNTATIGDGNPKAQYGEDGLINANNKAPRAVKQVPKTGQHLARMDYIGKNIVPIKIIISIRLITRTTKTLHKAPATVIGSIRRAVCTGDNF
jgi:hypothetical protein